MRNLPTLVVSTALLSLAGCYSSSEPISATDQATPAAVPQTSGPNNTVVPAPADAANPDATTGSAAGTAPAAPEAPEAAPAAQPPR